MITWDQFWHSYLTFCRLPKDHVFMRMATPSGWKMKVLLRCLGRTVYLVYPETVSVASPDADGMDEML